MKVSKLDGPDLDYWVAMALGMSHPPFMKEMRPGCCMVRVEGEDGDGPIAYMKAFQPSQDWSVGGEIITEHLIEIANDRGFREDKTFGRVWEAKHPGTGYFDGDTPLVAAMRAFVASKFGESVE